MARETIEQKGQRLYDEGKVSLADQWDDPPTWKLVVKGDTGEHAVMVDDADGAGCDCDAKGACSHVVAARLWLENGEPVEEGEVVEDSGGEDTPAGEVAVVSNPPEHTPALAIAEPPAELGAMLLSPRREFRNQAWGMLEQLVSTDMVPRSYQRKPAAALAAGMLGRDWGLGFVESLQFIDNIQGSVQPNAELTNRLFRRAGHRVVESVFDDKGVTVTGERGDTQERMTVTFTFEDAKRMNLLGKDNWKKSPEDMLWARAISRLVRRLAPDCMDRKGGTDD